MSCLVPPVTILCAPQHLRCSLPCAVPCAAVQRRASVQLVQDAVQLGGPTIRLVQVTVKRFRSAPVPICADVADSDCISCVSPISGTTVCTRGGGYDCESLASDSDSPSVVEQPPIVVPPPSLQSCLSKLRQMRPCLHRSEATLHEAMDAERRRDELHEFLLESLRGKVRVCCRVRPLLGEELARDKSLAVSVDADTMTVRLNGKTNSEEDARFAFDAAYSAGAGQREVFEGCRDLASSVAEGHNVTIFTYGQTGSGKTHTLYGSQGDADLERGDAGLGERMADEVFRLLEGGVASGGLHQFCVKASMLELYNGDIYDLFDEFDADDDSYRTKLKTRSRPTGMQVLGLEEREAQSAAALWEFLRLGAARRATAANALNATSSRSHTIFTIEVTTKRRGDAAWRSSRLVLCDLAGCERIKHTKAPQSQQKAAIEINKSLSALHGVLQALAERNTHVPYKDHKLTQLLQENLGGTGKVCTILTLSPTSSSLPETAACLRFVGWTTKLRVTKAERAIVDLKLAQSICEDVKLKDMLATMSLVATDELQRAQLVHRDLRSSFVSSRYRADR